MLNPKPFLDSPEFSSLPFIGSLDLPIVKVIQFYLTFPLKKLPPKIDKDQNPLWWWPHFQPSLACLLSNAFTSFTYSSRLALVTNFLSFSCIFSTNFDFLVHVRKKVVKNWFTSFDVSPTTLLLVIPHVPLIFIFLLSMN
jgi:hypothetical protein